MKKILPLPILSFTSHFISIIFIFLASVLIRYPIYFNNDHFITADDALMANTIVNILNGGPIVFYYDFARYFGLTGGIVSVPFMWGLGFNPMAFNLPPALFYSLYSWTMYLIARIIVPRTAIIVLVLMVVTPPFVTQMTTHNWPHVAAAFLGNLIFLLFIKIKTTDKGKGGKIFFLFFSMGFAIYTYTYSLIYIAVIFILWILSSGAWNELRGKISFSVFAEPFRRLGSGKRIFSRILDVLIVLFFLVIIFSYVFGGFGIDIGGVSIFQVNNLHKPVFQLLAIILLRILVYRKDIFSMWEEIKRLNSEEIQGERRRIIGLCGAGFLLGLSPRIASILMGETSRGGQGFDVDFNPIKLIAHIGDVFVRTLPSLFSLENSFQGLTFAGGVEGVTAALVIPLLLLLIASAVSFCFDNLDSVKKMITLRMVKFNPDNIFILTPVLILLANTLVQNGSQPRYLFPLFGTSVLWISILINKFQGRIKLLSIFLLVAWVGFYSIENYKSYNEQGVMGGFDLVKLEKSEIHNLIENLESKQIKVAYSDYRVSQVGSLLSGGKLNISEFSNNPNAKAQKIRSLNDPEFAIIAQKEEGNIYRNYLLQNKIKFKFEEVGEYKIYWEFSGDKAQINKLRSLIPG